ncbi:histidine kinase [Planotetraspora sp. A-T 1434]|uniref:sensor histidine kinase n=1 Tax=Planotetraspora sp. A-T 1434 TaxID=2979219 RepID=UPI0021BE2843|nr:histidine kinase [Planotetraspora sp. A-T 1434]MCT9929104.1 histidine kinase [Planotetraspora sp. A-T 1434]
MKASRVTRAVAAAMAAVAATGVVAGALLETGLPAPASQWVFIAVALIFPALGWLIAARRPDNAYGWLLLATADCMGLGGLGIGALIRLAAGRPAIAVPATVLASLFAVFYGLSWVFVPLLFPDGRLPSRRWRPVAWISAVSIGAQALGSLFVPGKLQEGMPIANPLGLPGPYGAVAALIASLGQLVLLIVAFAVLGNLVSRLRRSHHGERGRLGWMAAGVTANLAGFAAIVIFTFTHAPGAAAAFGVLSVVGALPAAIAAVVARHNLLDIKVGIRGSRLYLVFDLRPTVDELLSGLRPALEEAEPAEQLNRLAQAVRAGVDVRWAAVELADGTRVVAGQEDEEAVLTVPAGLGRIACGPKVGGRLTREDRRLLGALAVPVGLAIQSVALAARLINAQEAERRRIERNIHDGAQQQLVALIAGLELARATGGGADVLVLLREQARQALTDLRELAAGIHPSVLSQGGLVEAVEERCSGLPVTITVTADPGLRVRRFPDEIEGAMYFTVSEAVANALKHASASRIEVRLSLREDRLEASVTDDGKGFDTGAVARRGLATLADRMTALGGGLELTSGRGEGSRVRAWVTTHA